MIPIHAIQEQKRAFKDHVEEKKILLALECFEGDFVNKGLTWHRKITNFKANVVNAWKR